MPKNTSLTKNNKQIRRTKTLFSFLRSLKTSKYKKFLSHCEEISKESSWELQFITKEIPEKDEKRIRKAINKEAFEALEADKPKLCIRLINTYNNYYTNSLKGDLIKSEANHRLKKNTEALKILKGIRPQKEARYEKKIFRLAKKIITAEAIQISQDVSPEEAVKYYIVELTKFNINPTYEASLNEILEKIQSSIEISSHPKLRRHELGLRFNSHLVTIFEELLRQKTIKNPSNP